MKFNTFCLYTPKLDRKIGSKRCVRCEDFERPSVDKYDELFVTFHSEEKFGSILYSLNSPVAVNTPTIRVYSAEAIINYDGSNSTIFIQETPRSGMLGKAIDSFVISSQIVRSSLKNAFKVLTGKWKLGHENLFRFFVNSILEDKEMPYTPEEAFEANKTFLDVLKRLP